MYLTLKISYWTLYGFDDVPLPVTDDIVGFKLITGRTLYAECVTIGEQLNLEVTVVPHTWAVELE